MARAVSGRNAALAVSTTALLLARSVGAAASPTPGGASAQEAAPTANSSTTAGLRAHVGLGVASRLMRSAEPADRLRGIERAASIRTPEALSLLIRVAQGGDPSSLDPRQPAEGTARTDPRALLVAVRGLAGWTDREDARSTLASIVAAPTLSFAMRSAGATEDPTGDELVGAARVLLARRQAALALATSGSTLAIEALVAMARAGGPGQGPSLDALAAYPPAAPIVLGGVTLTTAPMIALAATVGDLRTLDAILGAVQSSDPAVRAAALAGLGAFGDARVIGGARSSLKDADPRVRLAAADALMRLGAADAAAAIEALVLDDRTALDALRLAQNLQDERVTRAAAARVMASADATLRLAALATLARQTSASAVGVIAKVTGDPLIGPSAACSLGRSPSAAAMAAIEDWVDRAPSSAKARRLAARAYFVRRFTRGERSVKLDQLLAALTRSTDPRDRAVGVQAAVALGTRPVDELVVDPDPRVRRAAAMGSAALERTQGRARMARHIATERDGATRVVLATALADGDPDGVVATDWLIARATAGGPDAPLAALALARADGDTSVIVDRLLASTDPILRAHTARGLGANGSAAAIGKLVAAYAWEADVDVRRALVGGLSAAPLGDAPSPHRAALELAASLDPDPPTRAMARGALRRQPPPRQTRERDVAWLQLAPAESAQLPRDETAAFVRSDGLALPIAFDDDGIALVVGVPSGQSRLRLAPRLPPYTPSSP